MDEEILISLYNYLNNDLKHELNYTENYEYGNFQEIDGNRLIFFNIKNGDYKPNLKDILLNSKSKTMRLKLVLKKFLQKYYNITEVKIVLNSDGIGFLLICELKVLTLNMAFNVMANKISGTEAKIVSECQKKYNGGWFDSSKNISACTYNAVNIIKDYDLFGLQEVHPTYVNELELSIKKLNPKANYGFIYNTYNLTGFDKNITGEGKLISPKNFLLVSRGMQLIWFEKIKVLFINIHSPHGVDLKYEIEQNCNKFKINVNNIIMVGDFNDFSGKLLNGSINIFGQKLKINNKILTCCADSNYKYPGDYILSNMQVLYYGYPKNYVRGVPPVSDHDPVAMILNV